ncbi:amidohydrolase (plasmid) [Citricoccus sp. SGAir0253]|uniref:amidohydrolase n=1 Tax=Citricoccus sp. SGAir0253 TaxID=2567881 RepID=UPI0010CD3F98|nr:amidohydrolase [Citricoccus sp. SGAir0253]QCU79652.1 amidohydrolase [Citricoccus sp. SGAir0253]
MTFTRTPANDLLIINATVHVVDSSNSRHDSILVRDGRITAVGNESTCRAQAHRDADVLDAGGRTVVPGFIDAHNHLSIAAFEPIAVDCSTPPFTSLDEVLEAVERHCRELPEGQWVRGFGFNPARVREQRGPNRHELDEVAPRNPFLLMESNCHAGHANSAALAAVGISVCSPDPWGGLIDRDGHGVPTGTLYEAAINSALSLSWDEFADAHPDQAVGLIEAKTRDYLAAGITAVGDACVTTSAARLYRRADAAGRLPLTLQQLHGGDHFFSQQDLRRADILERIHGGESHLLRGGAMKIFVDRAYPDGAAMHHRHDGCTKHTGTPFYSPREVRDLAVEAAVQGIDLAIHGMGNCAVDTVLDAYRQVRRAVGDGPVLRLEHAFVAERAQAPMLAAAGVDLVANPGLVYEDGPLFGEWRGEGQGHLSVLPVRSMIDAGVRVSFASDHPCGGYSPAEIMWSAVARQHSSGALVDPEEAVTPLEALRAYTINPAHASGRASEEGSLEVGKRANLLVLDRDPLSCSVDDLRQMQVDQTYVDGQLVHERQTVLSV